MRRPFTFFSPFSLVLTLIMILILSLSVWFRGGLAFSPGRLSAKSRPGTTLADFTSHAEFETQCQRCHRPVETAQNILCMDCHLTIAQQLTSRSGVHGKMSPASPCADCHPDHQGQDFDPALAALPFFDHTGTNFSLPHHLFNDDLTPMACAACHITESPAFTADVPRCNACHSAKDAGFMLRHNQDFGLACLACHNGQDGLAQFDHAATRFPLEGKHSALGCVECHSNARPTGAPGSGNVPPAGPFSGVSIACVDCHPLPASHTGVFDSDCDQCHDPAGWQPANLEGAPFDHETGTDFSLALHPLDYQGQPMTCVACHPGGFSAAEIGSCSACHGEQDAAFIQQHTAQVGPACLECHDGRDRMRGFDHQLIFPLEGAHVAVACLDCHIDGAYKTSVSQCVQCHAEPAVHAGFFGLECQDCHTSVAWSPAYLKMHAFPLDHGESGTTACQVCHPASYVEYTCYGCHEHQPAEIAEEHAEEGISSAEMANCTECHPTGLKEEGEDD
jgi:hypothetical protein